MSDMHTLLFGPFRMDLRDERLWHGEDVLRLTNKAFAVLRYLLEHDEQLVTKEALLDTVWPDTFVSEAALAMCIHEVRQALEDNAKTPQFIETVRGRGYRFLARVTVDDRSPSTQTVRPPPYPLPHSSALRPPSSVLTLSPLLGRQTALTQLHQWLAVASQGKRQVGFITGEAGIGKTALVDAFIQQVETDKTLWIGCGQCVEQYGAGEAYLPVLEAFGRLCRSLDGAHLVELLHQHAPSWLLQMPALVPVAEFDALQRRGSGVTRDRMLRELAEAVEILTAEQPLVLVLEDLHWSDVSTLDWLAYVARRRDPARLLVLGTFRPMGAMVHTHPIRTVTHELQRHGQGAELCLEYLSEAEVAAYLAQRFGARALPQELSQIVHQRTNGNPLFLVTMMDEVVRQGVLQEGTEGWTLRGGIEAAAIEVPASLRQMIEQSLEQLPPEDQEMLEAASVVGVVFSAAAVAAGIDQAVEAIEVRCAALARQGQFIRTHGVEEWPDETVAARYGFMHTLYQEVLYERVSAGRRVRLHQQIGVRKEAGYGAQAREIAAELTIHFRRGRDARRAVQYLLYAGENAAQRSAHQEGITHLSAGLELLTGLPDTPERTQQELMLQLALGSSLLRTKGQAAPEVEHAYARARALCQQVGDTPQLFPVLHGLWLFYLVRAELRTALEVAQQRFNLAQRYQSSEVLVGARWILGTTLFYLGQLTSAPESVEQETDLSDAEQYLVPELQASGIANLGHEAIVLWVLGYPDQALRRSHEALSLARERSHPYGLVVNMGCAARLHQLRREGHAARQRAEAAVALATEQECTDWVALGTILQGWALAEQGHEEDGIAQIRQSLVAYRTTGAELSRSYFLGLLAEAHGQAGQVEAGLAVLAEALDVVDHTGERWWEAELHRLKGELLRQAEWSGRHATCTPEACFLRALDIARYQGAKLLELRASVSLSRLWQEQDKPVDACQLLTDIYGWFTEGG